MHQPKPKSAPPRLKSKFVKNRTNAMKEIEAWVRKDGEQFPVPEASRMSGQLTDNVTEERMLKAKLWELSKERYKFLSQNSYEQKVFSDRQQRKAGLRRVASASWDGRSRHGSIGGTPTGAADFNEEILPGRQDLMSRHSSLTAEGGRPGDATPVPKRARPKNARFSLLDRLDPTKKRPLRSKSSDAKLLGNNNDEVTGAVSAAKHSSGDTHPANERLRLGNSKLKKTESESSIVVSPLDTKIRQSSAKQPKLFANKTLSQEITASESSFEDKKGKEKSDERVGGVGINFPSGQKSSTTSAAKPGHAHNSIPNTHHHHQNRITALRQQRTPTPSPADPLDTSNTPIGAGPSSRAASATTARTDHQQASTVVRFGTPTAAADSMTQDPRYARLERTLCPVVRSKTSGDIGAIVNQIEALHVRPRKRPPDAKKTKIELKAFEYMKDKGFVF
ncbi:hypothetical protein ElyMa_004289000 [Elysia marginata]|uniref:Nuclear protein MDM1 n=1 Tax=Elysia marginata TaxID=1093978 RepID=A0AAV4GVA3_9GAST|nr:hypothetical protein ElyMa_004289000 [Elysia marginata]